PRPPEIRGRRNPPLLKMGTAVAVPVFGMARHEACCYLVCTEFGQACWPALKRVNMVSRETRRERLPAESTDGAPVHMDDRLAILQDISLALNSTLDPDLLIDRILDASIRYTGATT